ncbi:hypothetical protein [Haloarchaeobius sp. DFWS5]|uniref:hypothetical protein n=1 Tax=Haloarchaeobius sp. DFWS5 TaxID=3446114 RepID=UPI003EBC101D
MTTDTRTHAYVVVCRAFELPDDALPDGFDGRTENVGERLAGLLSRAPSVFTVAADWGAFVDTFERTMAVAGYDCSVVTDDSASSASVDVIAPDGERTTVDLAHREPARLLAAVQRAVLSDRDHCIVRLQHGPGRFALLDTVALESMRTRFGDRVTVDGTPLLHWEQFPEIGPAASQPALEGATVGPALDAPPTDPAGPALTEPPVVASGDVDEEPIVARGAVDEEPIEAPGEVTDEPTDDEE